MPYWAAQEQAEGQLDATPGERRCFARTRARGQEAVAAAAVVFAVVAAVAVVEGTAHVTGDTFAVGSPAAYSAGEAAGRYQVGSDGCSARKPAMCESVWANSLGKDQR